MSRAMSEAVPEKVKRSAALAAVVDEAALVFLATGAWFKGGKNKIG